MEINNCCGTTCDKAKAVAEVEALKAQVESLRNGITHFNRSHGDMNPLLKAYVSTPTQCLAEIRAQAGRDGFIAGVDALETAQILGSDFDAVNSAEEYANQIRQQAKGEFEAPIFIQVLGRAVRVKGGDL